MPKPRSERRLAQDPPLGKPLNWVLPNQLGTELGTVGCLRMAGKAVPGARDLIACLGRGCGGKEVTCAR